MTAWIIIRVNWSLDQDEDSPISEGVFVSLDLCCKQKGT
jgi:hypothetical protein